MKIALAISGYFSMSLIIIGSLFKIQYWPGAGLNIVIGIALFSAVFLPLYAAHRIKERTSKIEIPEAISMYIALSILSLALLFKVQHWPGGSVFLIFGIGFSLVCYIPLRLVRFHKSNDRATTTNILGGLMAVAAMLLVLSIKVNRDVLDNYIQSDALITQNNKIMAVNNKELSLREMKKGKEDAGLNIETQGYTNQLLTLIRDYKIRIISETEGRPVESTSLTDVIPLDNYDAPSLVLIGSDPVHPISGEYSAVMLKNRIHEFRDAMMQRCPSEEGRTEISSLLTLADNQDPYHWELLTFYHKPLAGAVHALSTLQNSILTAEALVLREISLNQE